MNRIRKAVNHALLLGIALHVHAASAQSLEVESGIYWTSSRPGEALVVERQGPTLSMILYTYDSSGKPTFFIAAGPLLPNGDSEPVGWTQGYFPIQRVDARLQRVSEGPVFGSGRTYSVERPIELKTEDVGRITVDFPYTNVANVRIENDEAVPPEMQRTTGMVMERFLFGFAGIGVDVFSTTRLTPRPCWLDLSGEWIFLERSDTSSTPTRLRLQLEYTLPNAAQMMCPQSDRSPTQVVYGDSISGGKLMCASADQRSNNVGSPPKVRAGCEYVSEAGRKLFSFYTDDIGLNRIVGSKGELPLDGTGVLRRNERVLGLRIE